MYVTSEKRVSCLTSFLVLLFFESMYADIQFTGQTPLTSPNIYYTNGNVNLYQSVIINSGATLRINNGHTVNTNGFRFFVNGYFDVYGILNGITSYALRMSADGGTARITVQPTGTLNVAGGQLEAINGGSIQVQGGTINLSSSAILYIGGSSSLSAHSANNTGPGEIIIGGSSTLSHYGSLNLMGTPGYIGTLTINSSATSNLYGGSTSTIGGIINIKAGTLNASGTISSSNTPTVNIGNDTAVGTFNILGATTLNSATITIGNDLSATASGYLNLNGGSFSYSGAINVNRGSMSLNSIGVTVPTGSYIQTLANGTIYVGSSRILTNNGTIGGSGTITTDGAISSSGGFSTSGSPIINIGTSATGAININGGTNALNGITMNIGGASTPGTFMLNGGTTSFSGLINVVRGILDLNTANLSVPNGSSISNQANGTIAIRANRTLTNNGTIDSSGTLSAYSPSTINIGTSSTGSLNINSGSNTLIGTTITIGGISSTGSINLNGGSTAQSGSITILNGAFNLNGSNFIIPSGSYISNLDKGTLLINTGRILTNNGLLLSSGTFNKLGTFIDNGTTLDSAQAVCVIPASTTVNIPSGATFSIPTTNNFFINGTLNNLSGNSINVSGDLFVNNILNNGDGGNPGTINVNGAGRIFVTGGRIVNGNASSVINVNTSGALNNYYGTVNTSLGSIIVNSGGRVYNVRGNYPANMSLNTGSSFIDSDEAYLTENLSLDYTWTITVKAVINGQGHVITFTSNNGGIFITKNASLLLRDVIIQNVSNNQIRCSDNNSTLSVDKCTWLLDNNYAFTKGRIYIAGDWNIVGNNHSFSYETNQISSLAGNANLNIVDTTFIYNTATANLFKPLYNTSNIGLKNSTLQASQNWTLEAGTLKTTGNVVLNGVGTLNLHGLSSIKQNGSTTRIGNVLL